MTPLRPWEEEYLEVLKRTGNISLAADCADRCRQRIYQLKDSDEEFRRRHEAAQREYEARERKKRRAKVRRITYSVEEWWNVDA